MSHDAWLELAESHALGALEGEDRRRFEAHLAPGCAECEARIRETGEALVGLARSLPVDLPPPGARDRLLAAIAAEQAAGPSPAGRAPTDFRGREARRNRLLHPHAVWWGGWAAALAAASLLVVVGWGLSRARDEMARLQGRVAVLQDELTEREATLAFLSDSRVRYVSLAGLAASPGASGWLLWNPETRRGLLLTRGLPPVAADRAYELWAIAGSGPVPAGVFTVDAAGRALLRLPTLPEGPAFDKFAVTAEPAGGGPKPTGAMHLLGTL